MSRYIFVRGLAMAALALGFDAKAERPPSTAALPSAASNTLSALVQTAAIVEGTVAAIDSDYSEETGPWTNIRLAQVVVHRGSVAAGEKQPDDIVIRQKGGPSPDGTVLLLSHQPEFVRGKRYVVLLRNTAWFLSPVVGRAAFRIEMEDKKQVLVGQDEGIVMNVSSSGIGVSEPLYSKQEDPTFRHAPRKRILGRMLPSRALGVAGLLSGLDQQLAARGLTFTGRMYDEPITKRRGIPLAANGNASSGDEQNDGASQPDRRPNP